MTRLTLLADIHGNDLALKAVLQDIEKHNVDGIYCLGDLVGYAPFPNEVIKIIRLDDIKTVIGNYDDAIGHDRFACGCDFPNEEARIVGEQSLAWTKKHISEVNKAFLRSLPKEIWIDVEGKKMQLVHGSPHALNEYIFEQAAPELLHEIFAGTNADILAVGHTHKPFHRIYEGHHIINAGSVGRPKHGNPNALYGLLTFSDQMTVEFLNVPYDASAMARAILEAGLPREFANVVRTGKD